ncbi:phosphoenolpyruvate hydrolase family protein [Paraliobacillus salinarum]|uniref:phosphoenolpyruvate hydrolase family protein n=1 Tax=Paraliobacillus salinarum TaxID=1158996 RepID=UPI0015F76FCC|nr:phosphoenolpyruvate hydrolase family protein [Paraliobacillus salinarum]
MTSAQSEIITRLKKQIKTDRHIIGVAAGSGLTARYAEAGGADFILALSSGYFRQRGVSSLAGYLAIANSNQIVMDFARKEIIPAIKEIPTIFGLSATDPMIHLESYIKEIKENGFAGINNYPTIGLFDGEFRKGLESQGITFDREVQAIEIASKQGLLTVAFVFNTEQAIKMLHAGADIICVHLGLTSGGILGGKQIKSLQAAKKLAVSIFDACNKINPEVIKMVYGGPLNKPIDVQFMYDDTEINGYVGGSAFERIPAEQAILRVTESFKSTLDIHYDGLIQKIIDGIGSNEDYVDFVKEYIQLHYNQEITLNELAEILNLNRSYLSTLFKNKVGVSFQSYLIQFRMNRACEIIEEEKVLLKNVADMVGYTDYVHFSKIFKKTKGMSPKNYANKYKVSNPYE